MVKRQTVWLSTMMVLSLMLIGYYTMNNQGGTAATQSSTGESVVTGATTPSSTTTAGTSSDKTSDSKTSSSSSATTSTATSDWYTNTQTTVQQQISAQIERQKAILANNNASPDQIASAGSQQDELENLWSGIQNATQMIVADGFKNAVIVPDTKLQKFTVYVQTNDLQKDDALKVMNIVSQQLDVSMLNISVKAHA
ncbi:SpoIIIAH-like family protein [Alicyclobacillus acidoterrestris]|uniref:SpoIIIAH-like family protein n=1 Tax=Alicyclobacillus acidoterrestris (strain ATCC 49025 / DSM 3922 / CIP 106132 / NCIMB 13137 / GD3B) TaxID=1356854 RepID=T0DHC1_ALIAG|nr:SpoIIIAH-like family protein [Alicyclobacillus acidoterrestris]EPZ48956.1 hypothetical protein N007_03710 [Alicyclobacillus acidoterrestris ATCC 49025]UNO47486.1 SpoIIIAH-like family protein [Alicyclobacillus acidoterrestris]